MPSKYLSPTSVSELIDVPEGTLRIWRHRGEGPESIKIGKHVRYLREDVERWLASLHDEEHRRLEERHANRMSA
ncbi:helix-turn-helix transcriptional regulator [Solicola gregarius]|uniref:Helix-turn-helix domain-containing protein n=1 Tax=Solicola gregarius TaxID=2908642 RepID=A0AA46TE96_9ACTN|nr:helix-turn-helix domain-containing protein [Solicola gregarius]UYM03441.1 helix-turn-helix domain-containing protein [Solicola gregarius]